ncbi:hypothetical protein QQ045_012649 [Rhodiola kirilowii]
MSSTSTEESSSLSIPTSTPPFLLLIKSSSISTPRGVVTASVSPLQASGELLVFWTSGGSEILDAAAPILSGLKEPVVIAKVDADKYSSLAYKHEIDGYPTLKLFMHGVPTNYNGPRKAEALVRYLKKFVAPNVSVLDSDSAVKSFVEEAGSSFPIFIGFGLNESTVSEFTIKYKK